MHTFVRTKAKPSSNPGAPINPNFSKIVEPKSVNSHTAKLSVLFIAVSSSSINKKSSIQRTHPPTIRNILCMRMHPIRLAC